MPNLEFLPQGIKAECPENTKVLAVAIRQKTGIRYGCASCRCGTCGVKVSGEADVSEMRDEERELLTRMGLSTAGDVRLACQLRIRSGDLKVDLEFQNTYSPDQND